MVERSKLGFSGFLFLRDMMIPRFKRLSEAWGRSTCGLWRFLGI